MKELLIRKIEDIPPRERGATHNHLHAKHPVVIDEAIGRIRGRVAKGEQGVWEFHHHPIGQGLGCVKGCLRAETVDPGDVRLQMDAAVQE